MNKKLSISDLNLDQKVDNEAFALMEFEKKISRQEKNYYNVRLGDKSGEIRGKIWAEKFVDIDENAKVGDIVVISGYVQEYNGKPQLIIHSMKVVLGIAPEEFLPVTSRDRGNMLSELEKEIANVKNPYLKTVIDRFWSDQSNKDRYIHFPAGEYVHHGYVGGLLEHVWEMLQLAKPFFVIYPQMNWDLFFTGLFFHDVGKLEDLDIVGAAIVRTNSGRLVDHIAEGVIIVDRIINQIPDFPEDLRNQLLHLILSHQGEKEFGSPVVPQTLEAIVLHCVDNNSADMNQATKHIEKEIESGGDFTEYHKWLKRSLYQKDYLG